MMKKILILAIALSLSAFPFFVSAEDAAKTPEAPKAAVQLQPVTPVVAVSPAKPVETLKVQPVVKLGYADMARISSESSLGKASQSQAKAKQEKLQAQVQAKRKQLDKQKAAIEATIASLTPAQREAKTKDFQKKIEAFQKFGANAEKEFQTLQEGLSKSLYEAIEQASAEYGKANDLSLVVVKRELLYLANGVDAQDVSEGIIKLMDAKWLKK